MSIYGWANRAKRGKSPSRKAADDRLEKAQSATKSANAMTALAAKNPTHEAHQAAAEAHDSAASKWGAVGGEAGKKFGMEHTAKAETHRGGDIPRDEHGRFASK
jgi:hypothetical protein